MVRKGVHLRMVLSITYGSLNAYLYIRRMGQEVKGRLMSSS